MAVTSDTNACDKKLWVELLVVIIIMRFLKKKKKPLENYSLQHNNCLFILTLKFLQLNPYQKSTSVIMCVFNKHLKKSLSDNNF